MSERVLTPDEKAYKNMQAVAKLLEAVSPNNARYVVTDVYFDFGQDWMWTTICRYDYRECQVLCPRDWEAIVKAESITDLASIAVVIRADKYFTDK